MKQLIKFFLPVFFLSYASFSKATHIVGGDVTVKSLGSNNFEITLTLLFDCITGSPGAFDPVARMGIFEKGTNAFKDSISVPFVDSLRLQLGDSCFTPTNLCVRKLRYVGTINLPNNVNGYYISWHRCCRNGIITNIATPGASGNVFYAEIPDPALANSTPVFSAYPDAYMCVNYPNIDDFSATDADGDSLVYTLVDPYDCAANSICSSSGSGNGPNPGPAPGPYGTVTWDGSYNTTSMMGDPVQSVNSKTGVLSTKPPTQGVFVICVKVEEYRAGVKIGEIRRDVQYAVVPCTFLPTVALSGSDTICLGDSAALTATGAANYFWSTGATTASIVVTPTATGTYTVSITTDVNPKCKTTVFITVNPCTGINEQFPESGITIFPNPAGENSNIQFNKSLNETKIRVLSAIGQIMYEDQEKQITSGATKALELNQLSPGIYLVLVITDGNVWSKKLIIE